jgi:hypothetical protein
MRPAGEARAQEISAGAGIENNLRQATDNGRKRRQPGDDVLLAANNGAAWWWNPAMLAVRMLGLSGRPFTADHLRDLGVTDPDLDQRWGALFSAAARANVIEPAGTCIGRSGRPVRVWIGVKPE